MPANRAGVAMIRYVHQSPKFVKQLSTLFNGSKKEAVIAQKAESIFRLLQNQGYIRPDQLGTTKRYIARRIKNCTKYDLGSGYRLITIKEDKHLFVMYIGAHDDCCRWIANNKDLEPCSIMKRSTTYAVADSRTQPKVASSAPVCRQDDLKEDPLENLDDNVLRRIFCGLIKETI